MNKGLYRRNEVIRISDYSADDLEVIKDNCYVLDDDIMDVLDEIESKLGDIVDLLKEYKTKEALDELKELKDKLY